MIEVPARHLKEPEITLTGTIRAAKENARFGVSSGEGDGDAWPAIREKMLAADILVVGPPIRMGQIGSIATKVAEPRDAVPSATDDKGRMPGDGKVAATAIVGNENGAHVASAHLVKALDDVGITVPAAANGDWMGECRVARAMGRRTARTRRRCPTRSPNRRDGRGPRGASGPTAQEHVLPRPNRGGRAGQPGSAPDQPAADFARDVVRRLVHRRGNGGDFGGNAGNGRAEAALAHRAVGADRDGVIREHDR